MPEPEEIQNEEVTEEFEEHEATGEEEVLEEPEQVTISRKDLSQLLTRIAHLEGKVEGVSRQPQRETPPAREEDIDYEQLTPKQFKEHILKEVRESVAQPIAEMISAQNLKAEIREVARENKDFWDYQDEVKSILVQNVSMSVQDAYTLAKSRKPAPIPTPESLKPKPKPKPAASERPGLPKASLKEDAVDIRTAAQKAADELKIPD